jgi:predicted amidophosphoribosyltransferase
VPPQSVLSPRRRSCTGGQGGGVLDSWLDLVHGAACVGCSTPGRSLCARCASEVPVRGMPVRPTPCPDGLAACFAGGEYDDLLRAMILAHKEHGIFSLAVPLGGVLAAAASGVLAPAGSTVLVPVPSRAAVVRARGHDPVLRIARAAVRHLRRSGHRVRVGRVLEQRGWVQDQAGLTAGQRATNLAGSMGVRATGRAALARSDGPLSLLVCDDVLTTGATAREAQRALEQTGLPIRAVVAVAATRKRSLSERGRRGGPYRFQVTQRSV